MSQAVRNRIEQLMAMSDLSFSRALDIAAAEFRQTDGASISEYYGINRLFRDNPIFRDFLKPEPTTATELVKLNTPWGRGFEYSSIVMDEFVGEPETESIMREMGGINMNNRGFVTPDNIDKVVVRTKDGREFEGEVTRAEYMPGPFGRIGFSELTVCTLKQTKDKQYGIKEVIFNNPATIVKWDDGTQTIVYCQDNVKKVEKVVDGKKVIVDKPQKSDSFNPEIGLAMAITKKHFGNAGSYNNVFREYIPGMKEKAKAERKAAKAAKKEGAEND